MEQSFALAILVVFSLFAAIRAGNDLARGWNDDIDWKTLDDALAVSKEVKKPVMLVIHKSWCGACKSLKPKFAESKEIAELSADFIMVNSLDDEEPEGDEYGPDGKYIPRIVFLDSDGKVRKEIYNEGGNASYKYYYPEVDSIVEVMKRAKQELSASSQQKSDEL